MSILKRPNPRMQATVLRAPSGRARPAPDAPRWAAKEGSVNLRFV